MMKMTMTICAIVLVAGASVVLTAQRIAAPARTQSQGPRLIGSLTPAERKQLPASTQVKLPSGQSVTLGTLRAQHESHMRAFAAAAGLGRAMSEHLKLTRTSDDFGGLDGPHNPSIPTGNPKAGTTRTSVAPAPKPVPATQVGALSIVPFQPPSGLVPEDYLDFCKAAQPTVCLYLPTECDFLVLGNTARCYDTFVYDKNVCRNMGGQFAPYGAADSVFSQACAFDYPLVQRKSFVPTGPAAATPSCAMGTYNFDPHGSVRADAPASYANAKGFSIPPGAPQTCVVQVRVSRAR